LLFAAQPEAPAFVLADASGWAVNDEINGLQGKVLSVCFCRSLQRVLAGDAT
jgi:hypothetical protein